MARLRRPRSLTTSAAVLAVGALLLAGCNRSDQTNAVAALNHDRTTNGVAAAATNSALVTKAQSWAQHLATASGGVCSSATLVHSTLSQGAPQGWTKLGENIACRSTSSTQSSTVPLLEAQLMNSPGHRANILDPAFNRVGIGIASVPAKNNPGVIVVFETQDFAHL